MHVSEIDWRIEPLHDVIVGIDAGLAAIGERVANEDGFDGLFAREHAEPLFGLGFVAAQTYAVGTVSDLNSVRMSRGKPKKEKLECYECDNIRVKGCVTRIELINAAANYFKHHDEWIRWPTGSDRGAHDTRTLRNVGITADRIPVHRRCRSYLRHELGVNRVASDCERVASAFVQQVAITSNRECLRLISVSLDASLPRITPRGDQSRMHSNTEVSSAVSLAPQISSRVSYHAR